MYKSDNYKIGDFDVLRIGRKNGPGIELIPEKGAVLQQIYLGDSAIPLLASFDDQADLAKNEKYKQTLLFPFPNRLRDGLYSFQDTSYVFPINEAERHNALHGFVHSEEFVITEIDLTKEYGRVELTHLYHGQNEAYPFPFTLRINYKISDDGFTLMARVENTAYDSIPYGFGWHPYFSTDGTAQLETKPAKLQKVNDRMLPTGEEKLFDFKASKELTQNLDNAFRIRESELLDIVLGPFNKRQIRISADQSFKFFQVYNPQPDVVAVEPVTSNINALNTGDELIILPKGEVKTHEIEINLV